MCSKDKLSVFDRRIGKAQFTGLTRLEMSICRDALEKFSPQLPSVKTMWDKKIQAALTMLVDDVLNNPLVSERTYRKLNLPYLLGLLSQSKVNLLVIGR